LKLETSETLNFEKREKMKHQRENHEKCMQMIQAVLDGSASKEEVEHFKTHMNDCLPCIEGYHLEKSIKDAMQVKVEKKCCPQTTVMDIRAKLGIAVSLVLLVILQAKLFDCYF
jgi:anti-sigma factor (TIGR02949 family)